MTSVGSEPVSTWRQARRATAASPALAMREARANDVVARAGILIAIATLPLLRPTVAGNLGPADGAIVIGIAATLLWVGATRQLIYFAYLIPVAVILVAGLAAGLAGANPDTGLLSIVQDIYLALWALACVNFARTGRALAALVRAWCITALAWALALFLLVGRTVLTATQGDTRLAFVSDTNGAGLYFVLSMFVLMAARYPRHRLVRAAGLLLLLTDAILTGSLGALSGLFAGLAVGLVAGVFGRRGPAPALALTLALTLASGSVALYLERNHVVDAAHNSTNAVLRNSLGRGAQSGAERTALTAETLNLVSTSGLVGSGPNTTEQLLQDQQAAYVKQAHDDWIAALVERGVLGLFGVVLLAAELGRRALRSRDPSRLEREFAAALPGGHYLLGGLATVAVFSVTHEVLHDRTAWTLFGVLAAVSVFGRRERSLVEGGKP